MPGFSFPTLHPRVYFDKGLLDISQGEKEKAERLAE
jgi:hypothetical protein